MNPEENGSFSTIARIIFVLLILTILASGALTIVFLIRKPTNINKTSSTSSDQPRELPSSINETPTVVSNKVEKGGEVIDEGILLKYPKDHPQYPYAVYVKKDSGGEHVLDFAVLKTKLNLADYLNKRVRVTGYLIPVPPPPGSSYLFAIRLEVEKIELL